MLARRLISASFGIGALLASSCVTDSTSIYVLGVSVPDGDSCTFSTQTTFQSAVQVEQGGSTVTVGLIVGNLLRRRDLTIHNDPSTVIVETADIRIFDLQRNLVNEYQVDVGLTVVTGSTNGQNPGTGVAVVPIIPATALALLSANTSYMVGITLHGRTLGHIDVEGGEFDIAVDVGGAGSLGVDCSLSTGSIGNCCGSGVGQYYCTDSANLGSCLTL